MADQLALALVAMKNPMEEPQRRLLGYLAAHEGEWAADNDEQWKWAKALKARGFALAEVVGFEKRMSVTDLGKETARDLGLVCPCDVCGARQNRGSRG